jgi:DNA-binding GntR family transcriptional regulator
MIYNITNMKLEKISTRTLREEVYDQLRQKIISAEISPGEVIHLRNLAAELGVSLMPVREAVFQLESEKVIVVESNKSIYVNKLNHKEMEEALKIRLVLETMAAKRACQIRPDSALKRAKQLMEIMEDSIEKPRKFMRINSEFHFSIYGYADSPMLIRIIDSLWARIGPYLIIYSEREGNFRYAMECHHGMCEAFSDKDSAKMKKFLQMDLENAARFIISHLPE